MSYRDNSVPTWFEDGAGIWFTSDTHYMHSNIIGYTNRPFSDVDEMDATLVANWNRVVGKDDLVFHLGDFCFGTPGDWRSIRERLNGRIILILGNHDMKMYGKKPELFRDLFDYTSPQMMIKVENRRVILNHCPMLCYSGAFKTAPKATWQLFGHVHSGPLNDKGLDIPRLNYCFPYQYDVGVDNNDFTPVSWKKICDRIDEQWAEQDLKDKEEREKAVQEAVSAYLTEEYRRNRRMRMNSTFPSSF